VPIPGVLMADSPDGNERHTSHQDPRPWPLNECEHPVRVTISFNDDVPMLCRHHPTPTAGEPIPAARGGHRHRRPAGPWPAAVVHRFRSRGTKLRVTVVLAVLLGGVAAITVGVLGGIATSGGLLLVNLLGPVLQRRRRPASDGE
jgi:hypothetical protein